MNKQQTMALLDTGSPNFNDMINEGKIPPPLRSGVRHGLLSCGLR